MTVDLRRLCHLIALADHGSFGRAAVALGMTQPALSRSVQGLERQVGAALVERSKRGVTPTDEGRLLIARARSLVSAADELDREVLQRKVPGAGQVTVGAGPYPGETIVPAALARFASTHPLMRVRVVVRGDWDELLRRLRAQELDFIVAETSTLEGEHDLEVEPLAPHPVFFVVRGGHPLARRIGVRPVHAFAYPFLALSRFPPRALEPMLATLRELGARRRGPPFPAMEVASVSAAKRVLAASDAIAPLMLPSVAEEIGRGDLVLLLFEPWLTTRYGIVTLKNGTLAPAAGALREALREAESGLVREEAALIRRYSPGAGQAPRRGR